MRLFSRTLFFSSTLVCAACAPGELNNLTPSEDPLAESNAQQIVSGESILEAWQPSGEYFVSPPVASEEGSIAVSALVNATDGLQVDLEIQALTADGVPIGRWEPLEHDWDEDGIQTYRHTMFQRTNLARVRVRSEFAEMITRLQWGLYGGVDEFELEYIRETNDVGARTDALDGHSVRDIARRGACSTAGVEGLSRQLAEMQACIRPGSFVRFDDHPNIRLTSDRVHPYLQASARDALHAAADEEPLAINSAFRTLADQYVLYHSGGCGLAARPGRSNHQSGRAVDVRNWSAARPALTRNGCAWLGSRDTVHFDCAGSDRRSDAVLAFQRLWNLNNPGDRISEDGIYGSNTASRLSRSPSSGFPTSGCGASPEPAPEPTEPAPAPEDRSGEFGSVGVVSRDAWGAMDARYAYNTHRPTTITIHHTAGQSENPVAQVRAIQREHRNRRSRSGAYWNDIGYHFLISRDGTIYEGRPPNVVGAHVAGQNTGKVGISFIGCFDEDPTCRRFETPEQRQISDAAICAAGRLARSLMERYPTIRTFTKHSDFERTRVCPGSSVEARLAEIEAIARGAGCGGDAPEPEVGGALSCEHARGGTFANQGCSAGFQCCDGSWVGRDRGCGECACEDLEGRTGCAPGEEPEPEPEPEPAEPGPVGDAVCVHGNGGTFASRGCSAEFQCCDGAWSELGSCGECECEEETGESGCGMGVPVPEPRPEPVPEGPPAGASCIHSFGGVYANTACSPGFQCCDGRWRLRDSGCGTCFCEEATGEAGCGMTSPAPAPGPMSCANPNIGITRGEGHIPRSGRSNNTLRRTLGISVEPYGTALSDHQGAWISGRISHFGGPVDFGVGPTETVALTGERARDLNNPMDPSPSQLSSNPENYYYVAMRWDYAPGADFWRSSRILIKNPSTGRMVVVRPVDWGPHTRTARIVDVSPQTERDLGARTDDTVYVSFAPSDMPLGPVDCDF